MKGSFLGGLAVAGLILTATLFAGQQQGGKHTHDQGGEEEIDVRTITGEIIDITCYMRHDSKGEKHIKCATYCANLGMPLGVLEDGTDKIYVIIPPGHEDPKGPVMPYVGKKVKIDAILYTMGGLTGLEVEKIEAVE